MEPSDVGSQAKYERHHAGSFVGMAPEAVIGVHDRVRIIKCIGIIENLVISGLCRKDCTVESSGYDPGAFGLSVQCGISYD